MAEEQKVAVVSGTAGGTALIPDSKNWTWVLDRPCLECGLDTRQIQPREVAAMIRDNAAAWSDLLSNKPGVSKRSSPQVWSTLEYACHVRDVFRLYDARLLLMLNEDNPLFPNWDQDQTAVEQRYGEQDPAMVSAELTEAAFRLAGNFDHVQDEQWLRTGCRSDGAEFSIETLSRYLIHDPLHHHYDVTGSSVT